MVDRVYKITGIRDASVKLLIKMAVKDEVAEADVLKMVELLSSPSVATVVPIYRQSPYRDHLPNFGPYLVPILKFWSLF
jgi:hypothetical protein